MPAAAAQVAVTAASAYAANRQAKKAQQRAEDAAGNSSYTPVQWTPYTGGSLQYSTSPELASSISNVKNMAQSTPAGNQYLTTAGNQVNNILSDGYKAMSDAYMTKKYENTKANLQKDFNQQQNQTASRLAGQGLTGSGISTADWGNNVNNEKQILANAWQQLQDANEQQTQANKRQAISTSPQLAQLSARLSQLPLENQLRYNAILQQQNAAKNQVDLYNNQQKYDQWVQHMNLNKSNAAGQNQVNTARYEALMNYYANAANQSAENTKSTMKGLGTALSKVKWDSDQAGS
jgi:hypothetical protein